MGEQALGLERDACSYDLLGSQPGRLRRGARKASLRATQCAGIVGDLMPNCFGTPCEVAEVRYRGNDVNGKAYVGVTLKWGDDSTITASYKEDELYRNANTSRQYTSHELDVIERRILSLRRVDLAKSKGHIAFAGPFEFYDYAGNIFRARIDTPIGAEGVRIGRFESHGAAWKQHGAVVLQMCAFV